MLTLPGGPGLGLGPLDQRAKNRGLSGTLVRPGDLVRRSRGAPEIGENVDEVVPSQVHPKVIGSR